MTRIGVLTGGGDVPISRAVVTDSGLPRPGARQPS